MRRILLVLLVWPFLLGATSETDPTLTPKDQKALRELENSVTELKESVHRSKARVQELEEAILRGRITGSKAFITFENQAEGFFALSSAEFSLNGKVVHQVQLKDEASAPKKVSIFDSDLPVGEHDLTVKLQYQGSDKSIYTIFPYFKDHIFKVETTEKFFVAYGKTTVVELVALDKGYFKSDIQERLFLQVQAFTDWGTQPTD